MNTTTKAPPKHMMLFCKVCGQFKPHKFIGFQALSGKVRPLYNCRKCEGTRTGPR